MNEIELKLRECPFCGGVPYLEIHGEWIKSVYYQEVFTGECTRCGARSRTWTCREDATREWNRRPIEDAHAARIAELESQVDDLQGELAQSDKAADKMRIEELEAERDKYKEALVEIADWDMLARSQKGLIAIIGVLRSAERDRRMSEPKFTPGPWRVEVLGKDCLSVIIYADKGRPVASLYHERYKLSAQRANAALIAAAPEMYEKLVWMQKQFDDSDREELVSLGWEIEDLLKKARGES